MKHKINIKGVMIPNDYKAYYDYFDQDSTCPKDVSEVLDRVEEGDEVEVYINSGGGVIDVGSEIYTMLRKRDDVKIYITGEACSAASVVAMAGYCEMSPTALMMVHCVSTGTQGNHNDMEHMAEVLKIADNALCTSYMAKTGMSREEALEMMEAETWLTAEQAKEKGLIDGIMFEDAETKPLVASVGFTLPTQEALDRVTNLLKKADKSENDKSVFLVQQKLELLKLKGARHE